MIKQNFEKITKREFIHTLIDYPLFMGCFEYNGDIPPDDLETSIAEVKPIYEVKKVKAGSSRDIKFFTRTLNENGEEDKDGRSRRDFYGSNKFYKGESILAHVSENKEGDKVLYVNKKKSDSTEDKTTE
jgi:hypothetical protein